VIDAWFEHAHAKAGRYTITYLRTAPSVRQDLGGTLHAGTITRAVTSPFR